MTTLSHLFPIRIVPEDIDFMGHVNNSRYLNWVQEAVLEHWRNLAPPEAVAQRAWVALKHEITYRRPTFLDDRVIATVLLEKAGPPQLLDGIKEFHATVLFTAPTSYRTLAARGVELRRTPLRKCVSAGEALPSSTRALWKEATGIELIDGIGATEMLHIFISHDESNARPGATGIAVPGYRAEVVDEHDQPCPPGVVGKLRVKGPTGCRYLADERQRTYVRNGWNYTGDAYLRDAEGYFHFHARTDDMIISAGYNIASPEVEDALMLHPAVAECGVIGWPDEERGQIVKAYVVLRPGYPGDEAMVKALQDFVKQTVAPYKYPRAIVFVDKMPRTQTGKLQRFKLRNP